MSTIAETRIYTPADLLAMPDGKNYELVDGNLVELNVSALSSIVAVRLSQRIAAQVETDERFWVLGADNGYQCFPGHPKKVRKPDVSVIRRDRLPAEQLDEGFVTIAPDLAVEVVSPNDLAYDLEDKVRDYRGAGVRLIWVVYPPTRAIRVHHPDGSVSFLQEHDELSGEDVVPGFRCRVGDLFPPIPPAAPTA